jgi:hypothetical protein
MLKDTGSNDKGTSIRFRVTTSVGKPLQGAEVVEFTANGGKLTTLKTDTLGLVPGR